MVYTPPHFCCEEAYIALIIFTVCNSDFTSLVERIYAEQKGSVFVDMRGFASQCTNTPPIPFSSVCTDLTHIPPSFNTWRSNSIVVVSTLSPKHDLISDISSSTSFILRGVGLYNCALRFISSCFVIMPNQ